MIFEAIMWPLKDVKGVFSYKCLKSQHFFCVLSQPQERLNKQEGGRVTGVLKLGIYELVILVHS